MLRKVLGVWWFLWLGPGWVLIGLRGSVWKWNPFRACWRTLQSSFLRRCFRSREVTWLRKYIWRQLSGFIWVRNSWSHQWSSDRSCVRLMNIPNHFEWPFFVRSLPLTKAFCAQSECLQKLISPNREFSLEQLQWFSRNIRTFPQWTEFPPWIFVLDSCIFQQRHFWTHSWIRLFVWKTVLRPSCMTHSRKWGTWVFRRKYRACFRPWDSWWTCKSVFFWPKFSFTGFKCI